MKKIIVLGLCLVFVSLNVKASIITSKQLTEYENLGIYVKCVYSGEERCVGDFPIKDARRRLAEFSAMEAIGYNLSKKAKIDLIVDQLLLIITKEDVDDFIAEIKGKDPMLLLKDYHTDDVTIKTIVSMPGEDALYALDQNDFSKNGLENDVERVEYSYTKEEVIALAANTPKQEYIVKPSYFSQIKNNNETLEERDVKLLDNSKLAVMTVSKETPSNIEKSKKTFKSVTYLRRFKQYGYKIMIENVITESSRVIDASLPKPEPLKIVINADGDLSDLSMDEQWIYKYKALDDKDYKYREKSSSYLMLEFIADQLDKKYLEIIEEQNSGAKNKLKAKAIKHYKDGMKYYDILQKYKSEGKVKKLLIRYENLNRSTY